MYLDSLGLSENKFHYLKGRTMKDVKAEKHEAETLARIKMLMLIEGLTKGADPPQIDQIESEDKNPKKIGNAYLRPEFLKDVAMDPRKFLDSMNRVPVQLQTPRIESQYNKLLDNIDRAYDSAYQQKEKPKIMLPRLSSVTRS